MKNFLICSALALSLGCQTPMKPVSSTTEPAPEMAQESFAIGEISRYPADISQVSSDTYEMEASGSDCKPQYGGQNYVISINGNERSDLGGQIKPDGCFKRTFRNGILRPGDNVVVRVNGTGAFSDTVPGGSGGGGGGGGNYPPAPQVPSADLSKVRTTAENNARCMANAVVDTYGRVERFRYNYYMGLRNGIAIYNIVNIGSLQSTPEYINGAQQGGPAGSISGKSYGRSAGNSEGMGQGFSEARSRFTAIVDTSNPPDRSMIVPRPVYSGSGSGQQARSIDERLSSLDSDLAAFVNQQNFSADGWSYGNQLGDYWSASRLYSWNTSYQFDLVSSWYRDDWAFQLWQEQRFRRCSDQVDYYQKLADSSQTANSSAATSTFRSAFKNEYDQVIGYKWRNEVTKSEAIPFSFGQQHGMRVAREYAYDVGYYSTYNSYYQAASIQGFSETYEQAYQNGFTSTFQKYESSPIVEGLEVEFRTNNSRQAFGAGSPIGVILKRAVNLGQKDGVITLTPADNVVLGQQKQVTLKKSENLKQPISLGDMGYVGFSAAPNAKSKVSIMIGGVRLTREFNVDWITTVYNMATTTTATIRNPAFTYIRNNLAVEWSNMGKGLFPTNRYADKIPTNTFLEQMVSSYENPGSSPAFKAGVKLQVPGLKAIIGARPTGLFDGARKARWDSANALFDRMMK
jgi:hypothetical protein